MFELSWLRLECLVVIAVSVLRRVSSSWLVQPWFSIAAFYLHFMFRGVGVGPSWRGASTATSAVMN